MSCASGSGNGRANEEASKKKIRDSREAAASCDELVLSVDAAPLRLSSYHRLFGAKLNGPIMEVSLSARQETCSTTETGHDSNVLPASDKGEKRRLVYAPIDRFPLSAGRLLKLQEPTSAPSCQEANCKLKEELTALPVRANSLDASFCFNLLNVRVASARLLAASEPSQSLELESGERREVRGELEQSWLRMEQLTVQLRVRLLEELSRVVKSEGKIIVNVFAYECCSKEESNTSSNNNNDNSAAKRKQQHKRQQNANGVAATRLKGTRTIRAAAVRPQGGKRKEADEDYTSRQYSDSDNCSDSSCSELTEETSNEEAEVDSCCPRCRLESIRQRQTNRKSFNLKKDTDWLSNGNEMGTKVGGESRSRVTGRHEASDDGEQLEQLNTRLDQTLRDCDISGKTRKQSNLDAIDTNQRNNQINWFANSAIPSRRYSSVLWRAVGGSAGSINSADDYSMGNSTPKATTFLFHRDSFSEAAKRLGKRLSIGGTTLIGRLFNATNSTQQDTSQEEVLESPNNDDDLIQHPKCDIRLEKPQTLIVDGSRISEQQAEINCCKQDGTGHQMYAITNVMNLFQDKEFAKRHRQSIAVQSFFTKSIEVQGDDFVDLIGDDNVKSNNHELDEEEKETKRGSYSDEILQVVGSRQDQDSISCKGNKWETRQLKDAQTFSDDELTMTTNDDSTTSGWTAPTSTAGCGEFSLGSNGQARPSSLDTDELEALGAFNVCRSNELMRASSFQPTSSCSTSRQSYDWQEPSRHQFEFEGGKFNLLTGGRHSVTSACDLTCRRVDNNRAKCAHDYQPTNDSNVLTTATACNRSNSSGPINGNAQTNDYTNEPMDRNRLLLAGQASLGCNRQQRISIVRGGQQAHNDPLSGPHSLEQVGKPQTRRHHQQIEVGSFSKEHELELERQLQSTDLSSFTLNTSSSNARGDDHLSNQDLDIWRANLHNIGQPVEGRKEPACAHQSLLEGSSRDGMISSVSAKQHQQQSDDQCQQQQQQRRAFSETEATNQTQLGRSYNIVSSFYANIQGQKALATASLSPVVAKQQPTSRLVSAPSLTMTASSAAGQQFPSSLSGAREGAQATFRRQVRSAEAVHYQTTSYGGGLNAGSTTSTTSTSGGSNQIVVVNSRVLKGVIQQTSTTTTSSTSSGAHHSTSNLIRGAASYGSNKHPINHLAYTPLGSEQQTNQVGAGEALTWMAPRTAIGSQFSSRSQQQQQQWCHSNTFSSSLNSDISSSGQKDTTEKDSSRRTSTLSGISSIYQQEISLGLTTPHTGGISTPANSQVAACSNMGSIPELANTESASFQQQHQHQYHQPQAPPNSELDSHSNRTYKQQHLMGAATTTTTVVDLNGSDLCNVMNQITAGKDLTGARCNHRVCLEAGGENSRCSLLPNGGKFHHQGSGAAASPNKNVDSSDFSDTTNLPINLQRVAQSLKSQLRDRLLTMRSLNPFAAEQGTGSGRLAQEAYTVTPVESLQAARQQQQQTRQQETQQQLGLISEQQQDCGGAQRGSTTASAYSPSHSATLSVGSGRTSNRTESTPTPTAIKSFFRSTSSAAFNAFASSFQSSSTSTPTAATVRHVHSLWSQQSQNSKSISSDVFEPATPISTTTCSPIANSSAVAFRLMEEPQVEPTINQTPPGGPIRSPLSPISVTSTRFFARIRDKFSLGPASPTGTGFGSPLSQRPQSSLSSSTCASTLSLAPTTASQRHSNKNPRITQHSQMDQVVLGRKVDEIDGTSSSICQQLDSLAEDEDENDKIIMTTTAMSHQEQSASYQHQIADTSSMDETTVNSNLTSTTSTNRKSDSSDKLTTTATTSSANGHIFSSTSSDRQLELQQQSARGQLQQQPNTNRKLGVKNLDSYEDEYDNLLSSRRPSFQKQLDEQVNQVYRMAVERKLQQNNGLDVNSNLREQQHQQRKFSSGLNSIIKPMSSLLAGQQNVQTIATEPNTVVYHQSIYMPLSGSEYPGLGNLVTNSVTGSKQAPPIIRPLQQWIDSSQQSIDSSSSARSLRSCWFSMPELYAMNWDSSSQSPSGILFNGNPNNLNCIDPKCTSSTVDELLNALPQELITFGDQRGTQMAQTSCQQSQMAQQSVDWPSNQLYKQVTKTEGQNWSLSDLNLTSDDIAPPNLSCPLEKVSNKMATSDPINNLTKQPQAFVDDYQLNQLIKCSTLDDSVCASIKSNSSKENGRDKRSTDDNLLVNETPSRPTSQNSTISNTSCALSDLNNSESHEPTKSNWTDSASVSPQNPSISPGCNAMQQSPQIPQCTIEAAIDSSTNDDNQANNATELQRLLEATSISGVYKQRAMSLIPLQRNQAESPISSSDRCSSGHLEISSTPATCVPRRRSAMGSLIAGRDIAPAATTLDLRLPSRRNRVKLTDLHPITFINDRKFLNSMSSLKKADDNKLNAIFNSPVGRRLSVNAEMAQHSPFNQPKSGIKIGLTGYVYINQKQTNQNWLAKGPHQARRPSLAPNFWLAPHKQQSGRASPSLPADPQEALRSRPRSASYTPNIVQKQTDVSQPTIASAFKQEQTSIQPVDPGSLIANEIQTSNERGLCVKLPTGQCNFERRRSTLGLLERLSESSIECGADESLIGSALIDLASGKKTLHKFEDDPLQKDTVLEQQLQHPSRRSSWARQSTPCLKRIGENDEQKRVQPGLDCNSEVNKANEGGGSDSSENSVDQDSSSSSDDGDIDKLVALYPDDHPPDPRLASMQWIGRPYNRSGSTGPHPNILDSTSERVVRNDMILKQLLAVHSARVGGPARANTDLRRYSAINLYQRDEDVFVANSMKRPPTTQIHMLQTLPILAGTLPVLQQQPQQPESSTAEKHNSGTQIARKKLHNQLPIIATNRASMKSIITGNSGLNMAEIQLNPVSQVSMDQTSQESSFKPSLVAEVDVEEQLNRLRQQEKRSLAFNSPSSSSTTSSKFSSSLANKRASVCSSFSSEDHTEEEEEESDVFPMADKGLAYLGDLNDLTVPNNPTLPAILKQPVVATVHKPEDESSKQLESSLLELKDTTEPNVTIARFSPKPLKSPPNSPLGLASSLLSSCSLGCPPLASSAPSSPQGILLGARSDPVAYSGSKSCEPFKQLDTIIEGRGLLLGAEQQADPSYANKLRRLSGNHSRRSSLNNGIQQNEDEWCKCDLISPRSMRRKTSLSGSGDQRRLSNAKLDSSNALRHVSGEGQSPSASMLDTVKSLARRTLNNFTSISTIKSNVLPDVDPERVFDQAARQHRSSSMFVSSTWNSTSQPTLPSGLLRERAKQASKGRLPQATKMEVEEEGEEEDDDDDDTSVVSSQTGSPDDSSLISLDDAENYRTKNKDNKMKHGRSLETSSSSSSISSSSSHHPEQELEDVEHINKGATILDRKHDNSDKTEMEDEEEGDDDEEQAPKVCYKCNKRICMEEQDLTSTGRDLDESEVEEEEIDDEEPDVEGEKGRGNTLQNSKAQRSVSSANNRSTTRGRRHARRSASMNSAEPPEAPPVGQHINRRKNKWHIQRNLAPKLKRQRSFSANYAPEVPNPMMPPPRRFSAAPTLTCPHRNKSSSHSSSSLHHTYSIDSSESMITVIPANRTGLELKRASRGSLSYNSGQGLGFDSIGSFQPLPRSPLSPRSPSRCSPGILTPSTSEPPTALEPPSSPANTCSSAAPTTVIQQQLQDDTTNTYRSSNQTEGSITSGKLQVQSSLSNGEPSSCYNLSLPISEGIEVSRSVNNLSILSGGEDNLSMAVENGTSHNSSRNELEEFCQDNEFQTDNEEEDIQVLDGFSEDIDYNRDQNPIDPDAPMITETINDFCVRHSREELEFLIQQVESLWISDCYFSERNSTLCMVIRVKKK